MNIYQKIIAGACIMSLVSMTFEYKELPKEVTPQYRTVEIEQHFELDVEATAYWNMDPVDASGTGIAYDGTPAVPNETIAVDPKVIPLGSKVYVPGIGWTRANDTGSAINGAIIDIAMGSREEAFQWGRRVVKVKVIPPNPKKIKVVQRVL